MEIKYFSAVWCGPCQVYKPVVEAILEEYPDVTLTYVDIDDDLATAFQNKITNIPTLVADDFPKLVGAAQESEVRHWLNTVTGRVSL